MEKIVFYKDIIDSSLSFNEELLGRKGLSLALLTRYKLQVPPFFILTTVLFKEFISAISRDAQISTLEELKKAIISTPLPEEYTHLLTDAYRKLSGFGKAWVAVRGSISAPGYQSVSFSGQLDTFLNIRDTSEIELAIKEIYASLFNENVYEYVKKNNIQYSELSVGIIVQKMIQSEVSGIMYTFDPITLNKNNVSIEAVFGLGDVLNDGTINPDIYVVAKNSYEIVEKKIVPQEWMKVRRIGDISSLEHVQKLKISKVWQYSQKIDENLIRELASTASRIETIIDSFQIVEWTMEGGNLWILQVKSISPKLAGSQSHEVHSLNDHQIIAMDAPKKENTERLHAAMVPVPPRRLRKRPDEIQETLLFLGNPASSGIAYGKAIVISSEVIKQEGLLESLLQESDKETILVTDEFSHKLEPFFYKVGGIITNYGGINSDAAITARELNLPAIVGTRIATVFIQNGMLIKVDGSSGTVYRIDELPENTDNSESKPKKNVKKSKILAKAAKISHKQYDIPADNTPHGDSQFKLFLPKSLGQSNYFLYDESGKNEPIDQYAGVATITSNLNSVTAKRIKRLKLATQNNLYVVVEDSASLDSVMEKKRILSAHNIRRSRKVKILLEVGTFFSLLNLERLFNLSIDGFIFNIEKLNANYGSATGRIDENLLQLIETNLQKIKNSPVDVIGMIIPSEQVKSPLSKELSALLQAGCNAVFVPGGRNSLTPSAIIEFSSAAQSVILTKK